MEGCYGLRLQMAAEREEVSSESSLSSFLSDTEEEEDTNLYRDIINLVGDPCLLDRLLTNDEYLQKMWSQWMTVGPECG